MEPSTRSRLDLQTLGVVGTVALCDVDDRPTANELPSASMSIAQCVRLADGWLVRLDLDRGVTAVRHGTAPGEPISWKRPLDEVVDEVLVLVREDEPVGLNDHPWEDLAEAARMRGVDVDAETLSALPYRVVFTAEAIAVFVR